MIAQKTANGFKALAGRGNRYWVGSEQGLDEALENGEVKEGTIADTYAVGSVFSMEQIKQYIRDQNYLSDFEAAPSVGSVFEYDGWLFGSHYGTGVGSSVQGVRITDSNGTNFSTDSTVAGTLGVGGRGESFPFKKGDTFTYNNGFTTLYARYYKKRDYSDR